MSIFTPQEINRLYEPFALDEHEIREGGTNKDKSKVQWFVYVRRDAIQRRLDEILCGEWETSADIYRGAKYVAVTMTLKVRGIARVFNGADDGEFNENIEKSAMTDAFKRVASMWGLGLYLQNTPQIWTDYDYKSDGKPTNWTLRRQREDEAFKQFTRWYNTEIAKPPSKPTANVNPTTGVIIEEHPPEPQLPPAAAIFGQNEQKRIPTPEYSKTYEGELTKIVDIQAMENGGKRYKFLTKGGRHVSCFGSDIFKAANIDTSDWKAQWKLDPPIPVRIEEKIGKDNNMYYNVTAVLSDTKGQAA